MFQTQIYNPKRANLLAGPGWTRCEELIRQFEEAWKRQESPVLDDYLQAEPQLREMLLTELIHVDLEFRLKSGQTARVEEYVERFPQIGHDRETLLGLITEECQRRRAAGHSIVMPEYQLRFPDYADDLAARLAGEVDTSTGDGSSKPLNMTFPAIPGYEIVGEIGRGGMGVIYRARDPNLDRHVALKFLPDDYTRDSDHLQRFLHEARSASALNHPHICTVHALGEHDGRPYIVLEFIEGVTLRSWALTRPEIEDVTCIIRQAVRALAAAHAAGVVHRDIKPDNIMVRPDGIVKVVDFGLARRAPTIDVRDMDTGPGAVMGTAAYMSPEQTRGEPVDGASDIFSLGIVLYQLVTGRHPFEASSATGIMHAIATQQPVTPSALNPSVPRSLEDLILSMLHKERLLRPTASEVESALERVDDEEVPPKPSAQSARRVVRRDAEQALLRSALERAEAGYGSVVCVSGEPGIGKTTLVEDFLDLVRTDRPHCLTFRGHCSERLAGTEAYFPVLDALGDLFRGDGSGSTARHVKLLAPTWHAHVVTQADAFQDTLTPPKALSQLAMLREFWNLLQEMTRRGPVVLFIDDVHWADVSTVDLLARIGAQCGSSRLLVIVTYRTTELLIGPHPFHGVKLELQGKGVCHDIPVGFLDRRHVFDYLALVFPGHDFPAEFIEFVVSRTEGSPLFMTDLLRYLHERGVIAEEAGRWSLVGTLPDLRRDLPSSVRGMIERKLERLDKDDRLLLAAASVQGQEFDSTVVAGAVGLTPAEAEERLQTLDRIHGLVRLIREHEFPDHSLTTRYAFVHVLYQQALYAELSPSRRAVLALALATSLQNRHEKDCAAVAHELACLFEVGRDFQRSAHQFWNAARNAARICAYREAVALARHGLRLLANLPPSGERDALELSLQTTLGLQLQVTDGFAAPAAKEAYTRARELCPTPISVKSYPVLWGLWLDSKVRSELDLAMDLAKELEDLAVKAGDSDLILQSQQALAVTTLCRGELEATVRHMEQADRLYDPERHRSHSFQFGQDPGVACKAFGAVALALLGDMERARRVSREALSLSHRLMQPSSQTLALHFASMLHQICHEPNRTRVCAEMCGTIATEHGFSFWQAGSQIMLGWATAATSDAETGIRMLREGLRAWEATGSVTYQTYHLGLLADMLIKTGCREEASRLVAEALHLVDQTNERLYERQLERLTRS